MGKCTVVYLTSECTFTGRARNNEPLLKWNNILRFDERAYLYNLVNKTKLVHNLFLIYLFLLNLSISICFGTLCAHYQEKQLCLCTVHTRQSYTQNDKYKVSHKHSCFSWWWAHSRPKHVEIDKYTKNNLCTKLALFTRWNNIFRQSGKFV